MSWQHPASAGSKVVEIEAGLYP